MDDGSTIEHMLLEIDEREVVVDGLGDYRMLVQLDTTTGQTYLRWTPSAQDELGPLQEIKPQRVSDALAHPMLYAKGLRVSPR